MSDNVQSLGSLRQAQLALEQTYEIKTGLDVTDFLHLAHDFKELGRLHIEREAHSTDLDIALILDQDIFSAFIEGKKVDFNIRRRATSVVFEELSHFVYLSFNHLHGRNITRLEMEIQSEIDRLLLAFSSETRTQNDIQLALWEECLKTSYPDNHHEDARQIAMRFVQKLWPQGPRSYDELDRKYLNKFFHGDLGEKVYLARK